MTEVITVPIRCPVRFSIIFIFGSNFFFDISTFEDRFEVTKVSAALTSCPERFTTILIFQTSFFLILHI